MKPQAPGTPAASYKTASTVSLYWNAAEVLGIGDVSSYNIYESTSSNFANARLVGTSTLPTFTVTGLSAETNYYFEVTAADTSGVSANSAESAAIKTTDMYSDSGKSFSPFVDLTQPSEDIATAAEQSGLRDFTLAFFNSAGLQSNSVDTPTAMEGNYANNGSVPTQTLGGVTVEPNGLPVLDTGAILSEVQQAESEGGAITVAIGGYTGRDAAIIAAEYGAYLNNPSTSYTFSTTPETSNPNILDTTPSGSGVAAQGGSSAYNTAASNLQAEYQSAVSSTGANAITLDIENDSVPDEEWQYNSSGGYYHEVSVGGYYKEDILQTTSTVSGTSLIPVMNPTATQTLDQAADNMRNQALLGLEQANPGLSVSFTLAVNPTGLSNGSQASSNPNGANGNGGVDTGDNAEALILQAKNAGVTLSTINIMAMDYSEDLQGNAWSNAATINGNPNTESNLYNDSGTQTNMATAAEDAAQNTENFLVAEGMSSTKVEITVMPGDNDVPGEVFSTQDATALEQWAATHSWVAGLSEWSGNRDAESSSASTSTETGVTTTPYQFADDLNPISQAATVATFNLYETSLNQTPGGFAIGDTKANLVAGLDSLETDASNITSINSTDVPMAIGIAKFTTDQQVLDKVIGGFAIAGMASAIEGDLTVSGTSPLETDANITSIGAVDGVISVGVGKFTPNETALNKITVGFSIEGLSSAIGSDFNSLAADSTHINTVAFADGNPVLSLTAAQTTSDASLLAKVTGDYVLQVANANNTTTITGHGAGLTINATANGGDTITGGGTNDTFVFQPNFGQDTVTDFSTYLSGSTADTISLPQSEFANFAAVLADTTYNTSAGTATITAPNSGGQLVLDGMTQSMMTSTNTANDFKFHT